MEEERVALTGWVGEKRNSFELKDFNGRKRMEIK